jgi:cob(I)alamin adenosyltransferase
MIKLNRIYTRTGDKGTTGLGSGKRVRKDDLRVEAYGTIDEANAALGLARLHTEGALDDALQRIQNDLFDLGADLCVPPEQDEQEAQKLRIQDSQTARLEQEIDEMNAALAPLTSFVLPGGLPAAAYLHLARTIVRRAERMMTALAGKEGEGVNPAAMRYVNRLSDHLFVAARYANEQGARDVLWAPGAHR